MATLKVGDELVFKSRDGSMQIRTIDRMTPGYRLVCGDLNLNYDLSIRGPAKRDFASVRRATDADKLDDHNEGD